MVKVVIRIYHKAQIHHDSKNHKYCHQNVKNTSFWLRLDKLANQN